jgi:hypothetical protein
MSQLLQVHKPPAHSYCNIQCHRCPTYTTADAAKKKAGAAKAAAAAAADKDDDATMLDDTLKCAICFDLCERPITVSTGG